MRKVTMVQSQQKKYFAGSLLFHVMILLFFVASFNFTGKMPVVENADKNTDVITATVVTSALPLAPQPSPSPMLPEPQPALQKPVPAKPVVTKPITKPVTQTRAIIIPDKHKQEKLRRELIAKQLLTELKKQKEQDKKLKQKALEAAFAKEVKNLNAKSLQQQLRQEQQRLAGMRAQRAQGIVDKYKALVLQAISQQWLLPANVDKKRYAELLIRVAPGGVVLDVQLIKSSGDVSLDRSARAAVFKASPLPVPKEPDAFDAFRQFVLKVKPENVLAGDSWMS